MECSQCGVCCKLFLINLNKEEYDSKKYKTMFDDLVSEEDSEIIEDISFEEAELTGANILKQKEDNSCIYLKDNTCSIHKDRPEVCTKFFCDSKEEKFQDMIQTIKKNK